MFKSLSSLLFHCHCTATYGVVQMEISQDRKSSMRDQDEWYLEEDTLSMESDEDWSASSATSNQGDTPHERKADTYSYLRNGSSPSRLQKSFEVGAQGAKDLAGASTFTYSELKPCSRVDDQTLAAWQLDVSCPTRDSTQLKTATASSP